MAAVHRKPGPLTPSNTRGVLCSSCPGKKDVCQCATSSSGKLAPHVSGHVENWSDSRRNSRLFSSWAQLRNHSLAVIYVDIRKAKPFAPFLLRRLWDM